LKPYLIRRIAKNFLFWEVKMRIIGITGNIACGKTLVGQMLLRLGAERYIDADALVHRLYEPGQPVALGVRMAFGEAVLADDGRVNRQALGAIVFSDAAALRRLEAIVHPAVHEAVLHELSLVSEDGLAVLDAVKLLEGGSAALCQSIWLVLCSAEKQLPRLMQRNHLSAEEAHLRLLAQPATVDKLSLVDEVIQNDGTSEDTYQQVQAAFERFCVRF
jgi:dephospho-CoA kinase